MSLEEYKEIIICEICNEELEYKENWGVEHLQKFPNHRRFTQTRKRE